MTYAHGPDLLSKSSYKKGKTLKFYTNFFAIFARLSIFFIPIFLGHSEVTKIYSERMVFIGKRQTFLSKKFKFFLRFGFRSGRGHEAKRQSIKKQQFFCLCFRISSPAQTDQATTTSARILRTFLGMLDGVFPSVSSFAHFQRTRTSVQRHFSFPMKTHIFFFQSLEWFRVRPKHQK